MKAVKKYAIAAAWVVWVLIVVAMIPLAFDSVNGSVEDLAAPWDRILPGICGAFWFCLFVHIVVKIREDV